jgi:large conductance mechanosensitive channel
MGKEFRAFILRGNVVDLAVGVIIGAAFKSVVDSLVKNIFSPIIGLVAGKDFSALGVTLKHADKAANKPAIILAYGQFINDIISFLLVALAVFFFVVKPLNMLNERRKRGDAPEEDTPAPSDEALILGEIRDLLRSERA